jgi:hypothetical protein
MLEPTMDPIVYPSGFSFLICVRESDVAAPGLFRMIIGCPRIFPAASAKGRIMISAELPGVYPMI